MISCIKIIPLFAFISFASMLQGQEKQIVVLHTSDSHGRIFPILVAEQNATSQMADPGEKMITLDRKGEIGGFAALAAAVKQIVKENGPENVLLLDGGDSFSDNFLAKLTRGEASIQLMNELGYEFMALGNHDFDFGRERTRELQEMATFPIRGANVLDSASGKPFLGEPYIFLTKSDIQIGILALGYRSTHLTTSKENLKGLRFEESSDHISNYLATLRSQSDIVIALSHEGMEYDSMLAANHPEIDIIVGGHSHDITSKAEKINKSWIVQAFSHNLTLGVTTLTLSGKTITDVSTKIAWLWHDQIQPDKTFAEMIERISKPYQDTLFHVIGRAATAVPRNYKSGSPFDFLVGQILMKETGSDAALLPGIGYGVTINKGDIKRMDLYSLMPHDSKLATVELTGQQLLKTLEKSAENLEPEDPSKKVGGLIQTAGIDWVVDLSQPVNNRVSDVTVNGQPLDKNKSYKIATHNGMLEGLHGYDEIGKGKAIEKSDKTIVAVAEKHISSTGDISAPEPGIILKEKNVSANK